MLGNKAQSVIVELQDGKTYKMDFDMGALANAECVYEQRFGKLAGVNEIIADLVQAKAHAMMAVAYGAMISAGEKITWEHFCKSIYTFANYSRLTEMVTEAMVAMMRSEEEPEEGGEKNAHSRGAS